MGGQEIKLSAYADDADLLTPDTESLESNLRNISAVLFIETQLREVKGMLVWYKERV